MRKTPILAGVATAAGLITTLGVVALPAAGAQARGQHGGSRVTVIASHLNNPRGLAWGPGRSIFLAEAGRGGKTCLSGGPEGETCVGLTGSFDLIGRGGVHRLVTGLISASGAGGVAAEGLVSVSRAPHGNVYALFGENTHIVPPKGAIPERLRQAALHELGRLFLGTRHGAVSVARVGDHDWTWTSKRVHLAPQDFPDANPNNVVRAGGRTYVVDAGANTLTQVLRHGRTKVVKFFPVAHYPPDAVPTCAARGPDGALYVGELLGGSYAPGHARIWRIAGGHARVWATGLTTVQGCGFGRGGAFYATEFQTGGLASSNPAGDVVRIGRDGHRTHLGVGKLFNPSGFLAGPHGSFYVSNCSIAPASGLGPKLCPTGGQVVRIG